MKKPDEDKKDDIITANNIAEYIQIYEQVNETQRYEGAGIWSRFNIIVSLNIILFGVLTFVITTNLTSARLLFIVVSFAGGMFSLWSIYVLRRLWLWHSHWKMMLQNIESKFPSYLPRPFTSRPKNLTKSTTWYQSWLLSYTQPFMFILLFMWLVLLGLSINGSIFNKEEENNIKDKVEIIKKDELSNKNQKILINNINDTIKISKSEK